MTAALSSPKVNGGPDLAHLLSETEKMSDCRIRLGRACRRQSGLRERDHPRVRLAMTASLPNHTTASAVHVAPKIARPTVSLLRISPANAMRATAKQTTVAAIRIHLDFSRPGIGSSFDPTRVILQPPDMVWRSRSRSTLFGALVGELLCAAARHGTLARDKAI